ncbi:MAG TPA: class I SAM-dependent methyltransferase [Acidobacteriaceae bacterium]|nr:class I SAM-dependent methyltransferase [Acidobacteriaceae bacterium]
MYLARNIAQSPDPSSVAFGSLTLAQNVYDRPDFFKRYSQFPRSIHGLAGAPEWPEIRSMLPKLAGLRVADLGCGYGWFCRWARENGAASVLGLDLSEKMLARARAMTSDDGVTYSIADLEHLNIPIASFDLVYSSLAFHYVEDAARLFASIYKSLVPGGHLVFTTEHPIFMASLNPGWRTADDGHRLWPVDHYFVEGERKTDWLTSGVIKYHRTMATTLTSLQKAGFRIEQVKEFCPTTDQVAADPLLQEEIDRPTFLLIAAQK